MESSVTRHLTSDMLTELSWENEPG